GGQGREGRNQRLERGGGEAVWTQQGGDARKDDGRALPPRRGGDPTPADFRSRSTAWPLGRRGPLCAAGWNGGNLRHGRHHAQRRVRAVDLGDLHPPRPASVLTLGGQSPSYF